VGQHLELVGGLLRHICRQGGQVASHAHEAGGFVLITRCVACVWN
jgi:hypothetical protein